MDIMFGFELLWKIAILHVVAIAAHRILRLRNMTRQNPRERKRLLAKHRILTKMFPISRIHIFLVNNNKIFYHHFSQ